MTTYSRTDLATRALRKAGLVAAEETPSAADLDFAAEGIASDTEALAQVGITIINGDDQAVPQGFLEPLARYHAVTFKEDFGLINAVEAETARELQRRQLYKLCVTPATGIVAEAEYF